MKRKPEVSLRLFGPNAGEHIEEAGKSLLALMEAVTEERFGKDVPIRWKLGTVGLACDGCDARVQTTTRPPDWIYLAPNDYCPDCQLAFMPPGSMEAAS